MGVPAASREGPHWRKQYGTASETTLANLCRATQYPVLPSELEGDEGPDDALGHSSNSSLRHVVWMELGRTKALLVLRFLRPALQSAMTLVRQGLASALQGRGVDDIEMLRESVSLHRQALTALRKSHALTADLNRPRLVESIVALGEKHIQSAVDQVRAQGGVPVREGEEEDLVARMNFALEETEKSLMHLQQNWVLHGDQGLIDLCNSLGIEIVEPIALVAEVESQFGVVRVFESVLHMMFMRFRGQSADRSEWFASTGQYYMDGIRATASEAADRIVDKSREKLAAAVQTVETEIVQRQWALADSERWQAKLSRLQCLFLSLLWMQKGILVDVPEDDLMQLSGEQRSALELWAATSVDGRAAAVELTASRPEWTRWMMEHLTFDTCLFKTYQQSEKAPETVEELLHVVRQIVFAHAVESDISQPASADYFQRLRALCDGVDSVGLAAARVCQATQHFRGADFCSVLSAAIRGDSLPLLVPAVKFTLALSTSLLTARVVELPGRWPADGQFYAGGYLAEGNLPFFFQGRRFLLPGLWPMRRSYGEAKASAAQRAAPGAGRHPVIWTVQVDPQAPNIHAYFFEETGCVNFAPYACFRVEHTHWEADVSADAPHHVALSAYVSGCEEELTSGSWPLAPRLF